jgi:hypothetical protein
LVQHDVIGPKLPVGMFATPQRGFAKPAAGSRHGEIARVVSTPKDHL